MEKKSCKSCTHFFQHYAMNQRKIFRVYCGHCTLSKPRTKKPDTPACADFQDGEPDENAFVSKEYLSKELLQYLLRLELLPAIEDSTQR